MDVVKRIWVYIEVKINNSEITFDKRFINLTIIGSRCSCKIACFILNVKVANQIHENKRNFASLRDCRAVSVVLTINVVYHSTQLLIKSLNKATNTIFIRKESK